ncbi:MAG: ATP-binding protein [Bacteroidia bacterium]|nr:ATP-binding protein [Bacteroidia bacterium]
MEIRYTSIKKKTLLAFVISTLALFAVYTIYQYALQNIRQSVIELAKPNSKLQVVNSLYFEINKSEKSFRELILDENEYSFKQFVTEADIIKERADSLSGICDDNAIQRSLMDSIQQLILRRNELVLDYLNFKKNLRIHNPVKKQIKKLSELVAQEQESQKALIRSKEERKISYKIDTLSISSEKQTLWDKLFNRNKNIEVKLGSTKKETVNSKVDTVILNEDKEQAEAIQKIVTELRSIQKSNLKLDQLKELKIIQFEREFNTKMKQLLSSIETEFLVQTETAKNLAEENINKSITRINLLMLLFFVAIIVVVFFIFSDVNKINKLNELLAEAKNKAEFESRAKQRFLSTMSHEIRTPLQSIIGYTEQSIKQKEKVEEFLPMVQQSGEHLLQVVNEILDYSRLNSGKFSFEKNEFELFKTLTQLADMLRPQAVSKGLNLIINPTKEMDLRLIGDEFRLKQILLNLLGNAIKYTEKGSVCLELNTIIKDGICNLLFKISDTGIGIPVNKLSLIFEAFEQAKQENSYIGSGLGLSITKTLIEEQGGEISVESELGKGSIFSFTISYPISKSKEEKTELNKEITLPGNLKVWMIDDDSFIRNLCAIIFTQHQIKHQCFSSAKTLLEAAKNDCPDVLLADIRMPDMSGFDLWTELQKIWHKSVPIFALSAQALPPEKESILAHGFYGLISKPFKEQELLLSLQAISEPTSTVENPCILCHFDFSNLSKMLGNTIENILPIIKNFQQETQSDLAKIEVFISENRADELALYMHKIAGRFAQLGSGELATIFRSIEKKLDQKVAINEITELRFSLEKLRYNNEELVNIVFLHFGVEGASIYV